MSSLNPLVLRGAKALVSMALAGLLVACGGGGDDPAVATVTLTGVAATGAAIPGATVKAVNARGVAATAVTAADGSFKIDIADGAPFVLSVVDAASKAWYSYAAQAGVAHITPLTTLALLDANGGKPLADLVAGWSAARLSDTQVLEAAKKVNANLRSVMQAQGLDANGLNIFNATFSANHTGMDAVLDAMRVNIDCSATQCTQSIKSPAGSVLVNWNGNIATTGIAVSWTATTSGGGSTGGTVTVGLGSCKAPLAGTWSMVVQTTVAGVALTIPEVCIDGLPAKPETQQAFCADPGVTQQMPAGVSIVSCTYDGSSGTIAARVTQPITIDYSVKYTFVKR